MSYGINPVAVDLARVEASLGGGDEGLIQTILDAFADRFERDRVDPDDEDEPTLDQALRELVSGAPPREGYGHKYAYLLEMLCLNFGESLPNANFSAMDSSWASSVDLALESVGAPEDRLRVENHLMYRGSPIPLPRPEDFPSVGYLRKEEVGPALAALDSANLDALEPEEREAIEELRGWLTNAARTHRDLVCFYY